MGQGNVNFGNGMGTGTVGADRFIGPVTGDVAGNITGTTANFTGAATFGALSGAVSNAVTTVAAAGATVGTATAIPTTANLVYVTVTASTEGVKLPTWTTGARLEMIASLTVGNKVYAAAAGQSIATGTTNTTAFALPKNTISVFRAGNVANKWYVLRGA
jgi:hypothetical protein